MSLISLFKGLQKGWLKDVLTGAGLTLGTSAVTLTILNQMVSKLKSDLNSMSGVFLNLMSLGGFDVAMSIVLGAIVSRHAMSAGNIILKRK